MLKHIIQCKEQNMGSQSKKKEGGGGLTVDNFYILKSIDEKITKKQKF